MKTILFITLLSDLFLSSCGKGPADNNATDANFVSVYLENEILKDRPYLKLKNEAFDRDFMLYGTFIPMLESPSGHSLKGRIVRFQKYADRVVLLESPSGHAIGENGESTILLADFPIVLNEADGLVIDFARGMSNAFTTRNVHTNALSEQEGKSGEQFRAIALNNSFIKEIVADFDVITITQVAQWRNNKGELLSAELRYNLREYIPSPTFKRKNLGKNRHVQFFSTPSQMNGVSTENMAFIAKWLIDNPITFYVSDNTPEVYKQPIKDGILFWNHIFGRTIFEVKDLEKGIKAPHPRLNIVQWVTWDNEASAYADMVMDHQSGQILQAQVYVRSGWVVTSEAKLRAQLEKLLIDEPTSENPTKPEGDFPIPSMFENNELCIKNLDNSDALVDLTAYLSAVKISPEILKILSGDILRAVIAHEMGHILGLRHNLASSLAGNISLEERHTLLKNYLKTATPNMGVDKYLTRSIMDVFSAADDALMGSQIRELINSDIRNSKLKEIYQYDREAIEYGYFDKSMPGHSPFCTDEDIPRYLDCRRWDVSYTPLLYSASKLNSGPTYVAMVLADTFMGALDPKRPGGAISLKDVPLNSLKVLKTMGTNGKELFAWFNEQSRSIQIESRFPAYGPQNQAEINAARWQSLNDQIAIKGLNTTLFSLLPPFKTHSLEPSELTAMMQKHLAALAQELTLKNPRFYLSEQEMKDAMTISRSFFTTLSKNIDTLMALVISQSHFDLPALQMPFEEAIGQIAKELVLRTNETPAGSTALPVFTYSLATREAGAQLLSPTIGILPDWSFDTTALISNELKKLMKRYGGTAEADGAINLKGLPRNVRQWLLEQNRIMGILSRLKTLNRPSPAPSI